MAYCRFSDGDVYLYHDVAGHIECCACRLTKKKSWSGPKYINKGGRVVQSGTATYRMHQCQRFYTYREALAHLYEHKQKGHKVGRGAIKYLKRDIAKYGDARPATYEEGA